VEDVFRLAVLFRTILLLGFLVFFRFILLFGDDDDDDELGLIFLFSFPGGLKHWLDGIGW
jgi:hypothetical protein